VIIFSWDEIRDRETPLFPGAVQTALTIGGFDGPHRGHDRLFTSVLAQEGLLPGIITFSRSPRAFPELKGGFGEKALPGTELFGGDVSTLMLRLERFRERGFAFVVVIDFSQEFSKLSGELFLNILVRICAMRYIAVGPDFRCGYRLDTGTRELLDFAAATGVRAEILDACLVDGRRVSSSSIRRAVLDGDLREAEKLLGSPFRLDCSAFVPSDTPGTVVAEKESLTQVVPPDGEYPVIAVGEDGSLGEALIRISSGKLLLVSDLKRIRIAEFI
jgi:FAD synthase